MIFMNYLFYAFLHGEEIKIKEDHTLLVAVGCGFSSGGRLEQTPV
jgi:hypothetical protein